MSDDSQDRVLCATCSVISRGIVGHCRHVQSAIATAIKEVLREHDERLRTLADGLRRKLIEFGGHQPTCEATNRMGPALEVLCDCGWAEAIAPKKKDKENNEGDVPSPDGNRPSQSAVALTRPQPTDGEDRGASAAG